MPAQGGGPMAEPLGRLHLLTDCRPGRDRGPVVRAALSVGVPVVQVRVPDGWSDRAAYALASVVAGLCREAGATCLINDRLDVALAVGADGAHVGADDLPVAAARRVLGNAILGGTARDPATARQAARDGATYLGVGPAYRTSTKDGLPEPLGPPGIRAVAGAAGAPLLPIRAPPPDPTPPP